MSTIARFDGLEENRRYFEDETFLAKAVSSMPPEPLPLWRIAAPILVFLVLLWLGHLPKRPLLAILLHCCLAVIAYAMLQDQFSVRLSKEYFTLGHAPIAGLDNPTLLGLAWGFLGGFPGGIVLGIPLALAATLGPWPHVEPERAESCFRLLGGRGSPSQPDRWSQRLVQCGRGQHCGRRTLDLVDRIGTPAKLLYCGLRSLWHLPWWPQQRTAVGRLGKLSTSHQTATALHKIAECF